MLHQSYWVHGTILKSRKTELEQRHQSRLSKIFIASGAKKYHDKSEIKII